MLNLIISEYCSTKVVRSFIFTGTVQNSTVIFRIGIIKKTLRLVSMDSQVAECFHQASKLARNNIVFRYGYLGLIKLNFVIGQIFWRIQKWNHLTYYEKVIIVNLFVILVALIGLVQKKKIVISGIFALSSDKLHACC